MDSSRRLQHDRGGHQDWFLVRQRDSASSSTSRFRPHGATIYPDHGDPEPDQQWPFTTRNCADGPAPRERPGRVVFPRLNHLSVRARQTDEAGTKGSAPSPPGSGSSPRGAGPHRGRRPAASKRARHRPPRRRDAGIGPRYGNPGGTVEGPAIRASGGTQAGLAASAERSPERHGRGRSARLGGRRGGSVGGDGLGARCSRTARTAYEAPLGFDGSAKASPCWPRARCRCSLGSADPGTTPAACASRSRPGPRA